MSETFRSKLVGNENWKAIPGVEGYEASDLGRIRSITRTITNSRGRTYLWHGRIRKQCTMANGYSVFGTTGKMHLVSRCVLLAFRGAPSDLRMQACHDDGDQSNNRLANLRWDTSKGNNADKARHGTAGHGERHSQAKLTRSEVDAIRADPRSTLQVAASFGLSRSHVGSIRRGVFWRE